MSNTLERLIKLDQKFEYLNYSILDRILFKMSHFYNLNNVHSDLNEQINEKNERML
jgi:RIO-like serine/threonine protein kinase